MGNEESLQNLDEDFDEEPSLQRSNETPVQHPKKTKNVSINLVPTEHIIDDKNLDLNRAGGWGKLTKLYNTPKAKAVLAFKEAARKQQKQMSVPSMRYDTLNYGKWEPNGSPWSSDPRDWGYETIPDSYPMMNEYYHHPNVPDDMTKESELPTKYESLNDLYTNYSEWKVRFRSSPKHGIHINTRPINRAAYRDLTKKTVNQGEWANY
ncbi:uncharacterized protein LOC141899921 [Tubulanus polymorphus]|uniref:uncharacterized protein LOC141899921 n=1 Tax=Tubulanus polymorphus TaxID=672921 RepID=UPI003DA2D8C6